MNKTRLSYIDAAKAYLILLVILGHVLIVLNPGYRNLYYAAVQEFIAAFHMPAFFVIHGILFREEKWKNAPAVEYLGKRMYTLLVPYVFFECIGIVWKMGFQHQPFLTGLFNLATIRCNVGADWFLLAMFMGTMMLFLNAKISNRIYGTASTALCLILPMFLRGNQLTVVLGRGMLAYGFMMIGNLARNLFTTEKRNRILWIVGSALLTGLSAILNLKFGGNDFYSCTIKNPITLVVGGICGTLMILEISRLLQWKAAAAVGNHTMTIMGTHQLIIYAATAMVPDLSGGTPVQGLLLLLAIVALEVPVVFVLDRCLPFCVGRSRAEK